MFLLLLMLLLLQLLLCSFEVQSVSICGYELFRWLLMSLQLPASCFVRLQPAGYAWRNCVADGLASFGGCCLLLMLLLMPPSLLRVRAVPMAQCRMWVEELCC